MSVSLASRIHAVQVYRRGATVVRTAELTIAAGGALPDEVELQDLPLSLLDPTARVRVVAAEPAGADVVAAGVRVGLWVRPGDPPPKAPEQQELDDVRRKLARARRQLAHIDLEAGLLQGVPVPERPTGEDGKAPPPSPMSARLQLEQFVDEATQKRVAEHRALREQARALEEQERRLLERVRASSTAAQVNLPDLRKSVVVRLKARGGGGGAAVSKLTLELSYVVPGARWAPAYQCKLARDGSSAGIQLRAYVAQRTGEDWRGVRLKLSTASPLRFTELPELSAVKIGRAQPPPHKRGFRPPPQGGEVLFRDYDRDLSRARSLVPPPSSWRRPALSLPPADADASVLAALSSSSNAITAGAIGATRGGGHGAGARGEMRELAKAKKSEARRAAQPPMPMEAADAADEMLMDDGVDMEREEYAMAAPPPMSAPAPSAVMAARSAAAPMKVGPGGPADRARSASTGAAVDEVVAAMLYPLLRLPGAGDASTRGRLVPVDVRRAYVDSVQRFGRPVPFDVMSAVAHAEEMANVSSTSLPDGCVDADDISSHFDFAYEADGLVEITADGGFHSVALGDRASEARMRYIAVPREELAVYRVAALSNPIPAPLLPGPAEVYVGGEYVLTTRLPTVPARGDLKLGLGVEQNIKIARNTTFSERRSGEKVVAMSELVHDVDIDVVNHLEREIDIEVRERVPVPAANAEVVVEEGKVEPAWSAYDQEERGAPIEGGRRWEIKVAPGGAQKLHATYVVKIYAQNEIAGGNRREQ